MAIDRLPNHSQMTNLLEQQAIANVNADDTYKNKLERELAAKFIAGRNGKVFATKIYSYKANSTSMGERMFDSVGLDCKPSTDTVVGVDDFENASQIFQWMHCNYVKDADGTKRPISLEGRPSYKETGAVDIGTLSPTFWWKIEDRGTYQIWYTSDSPHPELGLVPWHEAVLSDDTVLPFYVTASYMSVTASDGLLRSQKGVPAYNQSYNNMIAAYAKKGTGYGVSSNVSRLSLLMLFLVIKYATKNIQKIFTGVCSFDKKSTVQVAESGVKRVLVPTTDTFWQAGDCVSVGDGTQTDRNNAAVHNIANRAIIESVTTESVGGKNYSALNLNTAEGINVLTTSVVTLMPAPSGQTDGVVGHKDGSIISNTDNKHACRIKGVEIMNGIAVIEYGAMAVKEGNFWTIYTVPKGVKPVSGAKTGMIVAGKVPYNNGSDAWAGGVTIDPTTGALIQHELGGGDSIGVGDRIYEGGTGLADGTMCEVYDVGSMWLGSFAGLGLRSLGLDLSWALWSCGSCD